MENQIPGPAAQLIDFGFAVKKPLCDAVDNAMGLKHSDSGSLSGFLQFCYEIRRPYFVIADLTLAAFRL